MDKNEIFKEYILNNYSKDKNYNSIYSKIEKKEKIRKKIVNLVAVLFTIITLGTVSTSIYAKRAWDIEYKEYQNRNINSTRTAVTDAINNNYIEDLNMDYVYQNGIGIKIDSLMITNDYYQMIINMKLDDYTKINTDSLEFGYAIYDENKDIYQVNERNTWGIKKGQYKKYLSRELGVPYNESKAIPKVLASSSTMDIISSEKGNVIFQIGLNSFEGLPKSKKINIRIFDIGFALVDGYTENDGRYVITDSEDFGLTNYEWQFEIDIPEKFHNRDVIELKLAENIEGFEIEKAELSETGLTLHLRHIYPLINMTPDTLNISNGKGILYYQGGGLSDDYIIKGVFDVNKNDLNKGIYLNINIPEHNISSKLELVKK